MLKKIVVVTAFGVALLIGVSTAVPYASVGSDAQAAGTCKVRCAEKKACLNKSLRCAMDCMGQNMKEEEQLYCLDICARANTLCCSLLGAPPEWTGGCAEPQGPLLWLTHNQKRDPRAHSEKCSPALRSSEPLR